MSHGTLPAVAESNAAPSCVVSASVMADAGSGPRFVPVKVYVTVPPGATAALSTVIAPARSACSPVATPVSFAVLLPLLGSVAFDTVVVAVTVNVCVGFAVGFTPNSKVAEEPLASELIVHEETLHAAAGPDVCRRPVRFAC